MGLRSYGDAVVADELAERWLVEPLHHVAESFVIIAILGKIGAVGLAQSAEKTMPCLLLISPFLSQ